MEDDCAHRGLDCVGTGRGVADGTVPGGKVQGQLPGSLVRRFIEAGECTPGVRRLELRKDVPVAVVLLPEHSRAVLRANGSGVINLEFGRARRGGRIELEANEVLTAG